MKSEYLQVFKEGEYLGGSPTPVVEGVSLRFDSSGLLLIYTYNNPTEDEIEQTRNGNVQFKFVPTEFGLVCCVKCGTSPWSDALVQKQTSHMDKPKDGQGYIITTVLADAENSMIKAFRTRSTSYSQAELIYNSLVNAPIYSSEEFFVLSRKYQGKYSTEELVQMGI